MIEIIEMQPFHVPWIAELEKMVDQYEAALQNKEEK